MSGLGDDHEAPGDSDRHSREGEQLGMGRGRGRGRGVRGSQAGVLIGYGRGRGFIDENSQRRDYVAPGRGRGFLASGDSDGDLSVGRGAGRGRIDENGQRSYVPPGRGRRFLASRRENVDEMSGDSGRCEELGAELSNVSGCGQKVKCFKCKKEGHKSTECEGPDRSKYSYEVYLLPRERMDTPQNEDSTTVDTYQEYADHIKMVFEKALENNPTYDSVKKCLYKDLAIKSVVGGRFGGGPGMIDSMRINNEIRVCHSINLVEVGQNFHLMVIFNNSHSTIHMKTKRSPITKSLQGLSAAKIAQTLMDQGRSQPEDADKLKLPDRLKNVVKIYL